MWTIFITHTFMIYYYELRCSMLMQWKNYVFFICFFFVVRKIFIIFCLEFFVESQKELRFLVLLIVFILHLLNFILFLFFFIIWIKNFYNSNRHTFIFGLSLFRIVGIGSNVLFIRAFWLNSACSIVFR